MSIVIVPPTLVDWPVGLQSFCAGSFWHEGTLCPVSSRICSSPTSSKTICGFLATEVAPNLVLAQPNRPTKKRMLSTPSLLKCITVNISIPPVRLKGQPLKITNPERCQCPQRFAHYPHRLGKNSDAVSSCST